MARKRIDPATRGKVIVGYDTIGRPRWASRIDPLTKLMASVTISPNGCHIWGDRKNERGYGVIVVAGRQVYTHRLSYELQVGPIPEELQLDHLCHSNDASCDAGNACPHRACCNPEHLEPVTAAENSRRSAPTRRTHCPQGHPYVEDNIRRRSRGSKECRECALVRSRSQYLPERRTHCARGHELSGDNLIVRKGGARCCRICRLAMGQGERGERNPSARLKDGDVVAILARLATGERQSVIAADFGVSRTTVSRVKRDSELRAAA